MTAETVEPENVAQAADLETPASMPTGMSAYSMPDEPEEAPVEPNFDLRSADALSFAALQEARVQVFDSIQHRNAFRDHVASLSTSGDEGRRRGLGYWILGDYEACASELQPHESDDTAAYTRGRALMALQRFEEAEGLFRRLSEAYPDEPRPRASWIETRLEAGIAREEDPEALAAGIEAQVREAPGGFAEKAEGLYLLGRVAELRRDWEAALESYQAGDQAGEGHLALLERMGHLAERCGLDEIALEAYERVISDGCPDKRVLSNLGVLYEDLGRDSDAAACYDVIVQNDATDERARLYLHDARAAIDMFYDEDLEKKEDRLNQILRIPITDFELSVRARNCLNKMQILTLGDLVQRTEQELLSYKNFGETSLTEIKEILHSKGLRLGMPREEAVASIEAHATRLATGDRADILNKPILELQLSIRARRTVETLGCLTVGDITKHSAEELLGMPNFGQTSLLELRSKLTELGVKLKGD